MDLWQQIRERYAQGGITHRELAEQFDVPLSTLRRRAAEEKWSAMKKQRNCTGTGGETPAAKLRLEKQLAVTDRMLDVFIGVLENDAEFFAYLEQVKSSGGTEYSVQRLDIINIDRIGKLIKAVGDIFELQRTALGLHDYKDELSARKLEQDGDIASRKLELERLKIEGFADSGAADDGFLDALNACYPADADGQPS